MAGGVGDKGSIMGEINVVPLVDVMLVLLIIFMVAAPMMVQGLEVKLPATDSGALKQNGKLLVLTLSREGKLLLDKEPVAVEGLAERIALITAARPGTKVYLRADKDVSYGLVIAVMAQTKKAGVADLGMVTEPGQAQTPAQDRRP
ncbi:MAG: biopolymer transporter ExbD [Desulfarculus sp.]|nr:biopolymer transporter ExbD [Desulfarculus sp.]